MAQTNTAKDQKDAAGVDRLIQELKPLGRPMLTGRHAGGSAFASSKSRRRLTPIRLPMTPIIAWAWITLSVVLGIAMTQWPYDRAYGWGLVLYLFAVAVLMVSTIWGMLISWHNRLGFAHVLSVATFIWSLALTAEVVLPRVGYAKVEAFWWQ